LWAPQRLFYFVPSHFFAEQRWCGTDLAPPIGGSANAHTNFGDLRCCSLFVLAQQAASTWISFELMVFRDLEGLTFESMVKTRSVASRFS
jgi:hypothetical protein